LNASTYKGADKLYKVSGEKGAFGKVSADISKSANKKGQSYFKLGPSNVAGMGYFYFRNKGVERLADTIDPVEVNSIVIPTL